MATFDLPGFRNRVRVELYAGITQEQLLEYEPFQKWQSTLATNLELQDDPAHPFKQYPFFLKEIEIQSIRWLEQRLLFVKMKARVVNEAKPPQELPGIVLLRVGSVAVLMILSPKNSQNERLVILTEQARVPAGSLTFKEIPAGMIDKDGNGKRGFAGAAAREIEEETGLQLPESKLIDLTELALAKTQSPEKRLELAMYPSLGGCDEFIHIFLWIKDLERQEIEHLKGKLTGLRKRGELIKLHVCNYEDLWREGARDAKTLAAWALYEGLNRSGVLSKELRRMKQEAIKSKCIEAGRE